GGLAKKHDPHAGAKLRAFYLGFIARPVTDDLAQRQAEGEKARADHAPTADAIPGSLVFRGPPLPRPSFVVLPRHYQQPGAEDGATGGGRGRSGPRGPPCRRSSPPRPVPASRGSTWPTGSFHPITR